MPRTKKAATRDDSESLSGRLGEFGSAVMQIADEKSLPGEKVTEIVEPALAAAYKKDYGKKGQVIVSKFDEVAKTADFFLVKEVVDDTMRDFTVPEPVEEGEESKKEAPVVEAATENPEEEKLPRYNPERDLTLEDAKALKKGAKVGDLIEIPLENHDNVPISLQELWKSNTLLRTPESVLYDPKGKQLFVANINKMNADKPDGDGFISILNTDGKIKNLKWTTGLNDPKGMGIVKK